MNGAGRVLVVDDTPANVKLLADLLGVRGYAVTTAVSGEEALAKVRDARPDLVLLDVMMPGLSGYDVCRALRGDAATALLPIVLVTSLDPQSERVKGIEAGADDFLSKPINQAELFARVRSLLRIKTLQDDVSMKAEALLEMNRTLEHRVETQVAELARLSRLKRFFAPRVADAIVAAGEQSVLSPHRREITSMFLDLRGFTAFTDSVEPEEVQEVLRAYHAAMGELILAHEGTLDRFAGDGIVVFFNDPIPIERPAHRAARMALEAQARFAGLAQRWAKSGYELGLGIGIAHGYATVGAFGFEGRFDYTAIGSVVNLAGRLCAEAAGGEILVDRRARAILDVDASLDEPRSLTLKGFQQPVPTYRLLAVRETP